MGFFYFDESIHEKEGFIVGAMVYTERDITPQIFQAIAQVGLVPGTDEFKSGALMNREPRQAELRKIMRGLLHEAKIGIVAVSSQSRSSLGVEALEGLSKIVSANKLTGQTHQIYFDEGIEIGREVLQSFVATNPCVAEMHTAQDSRAIGGIQLADLASHSLSGMLLEQLGLRKKMVRAGEGSGYEPDLQIELGFELWASMRYQIFKAEWPKPGPIPDDPVGEMMFDVENYGLHISNKCSQGLRDAALKRFGEIYLGCIH